jgi:hypothetical protein
VGLRQITLAFHDVVDATEYVRFVSGGGHHVFVRVCDAFVRVRDVFGRVCDVFVRVRDVFGRV